jgi:RNA polymerase sporulation-specific sigma factor
MDAFSVETLRSMPDEALVSACADQPQAFEILLERYRGTVVGMANDAAASAADVEDYAQEGMLGLLAAVTAYSQERRAGFRTFATVCIRNRMRNFSKKEQTDKRKTAILPDVSLDDPDNSVAETLADLADTPEQIVLEKEQTSELYAQIADVLSKQEREIFWLSVSGLSYDEIAERLQISAKSVDNAIQRARRKLRAVWSRR